MIYTPHMNQRLRKVDTAISPYLSLTNLEASCYNSFTQFKHSPIVHFSSRYATNSAAKALTTAFTQNLQNFICQDLIHHPSTGLSHGIPPPRLRSNLLRPRLKTSKGKARKQEELRRKLRIIESREPTTRIVAAKSNASSSRWGV